MNFPPAVLASGLLQSIYPVEISSVNYRICNALKGITLVTLTSFLWCLCDFGVIRGRVLSAGKVGPKIRNSEWLLEREVLVIWDVMLLLRTCWWFEMWFLSSGRAVFPAPLWGVTLLPPFPLVEQPRPLGGFLSHPCSSQAQSNPNSSLNLGQWLELLPSLWSSLWQAQVQSVLEKWFFTTYQWLWLLSWELWWEPDLCQANLYILAACWKGTFGYIFSSCQNTTHVFLIPALTF